MNISHERSMLGTIREMIGRLDSLTIAGQRHVMDKVVTALRAEITQAARTSERNRRAVVDHLGLLAAQSEGSWPDVRGFSLRAENLVALLSSLA